MMETGAFFNYLRYVREKRKSKDCNTKSRNYAFKEFIDKISKLLDRDVILKRRGS